MDAEKLPERHMPRDGSALASVEAEQYILSSILRENSVINQLSSLEPDDFSVPAHQVLFKIMVALYHQGLPVGIVPISEALGEKLDAIGGIALLNNLYDDAVVPVQLDYYVNLIRSKRMLRDLVQTCDRAIGEALGPEADPHGLLANIESELYKLTDSGRTSGIRSSKEATKDVVKMMSERYHARGQIAGVPTGFVDLDNKINGLKPSDMIVIAGRPGMGKTSFALNIAEHVAMQAGKPVLFFSLEMSTEQLITRLISQRASIGVQEMEKGLFDTRSWNTFQDVAGEIEAAPFYFDDDPTINVSKMLSRTRHEANRIRSEMRQQGREDEDRSVFGAIMIDYLQLMSGRGGDSREREVSEISRGLKMLAKQLHVPVIALSQLNRGLEQRQNKRPLMSDLRESGAIEQDADLILFIYRESFYKRNSEEGEDEKSMIQQASDELPISEIIIAKNRHGPTGTVELYFDGRFTRFSTPARFADEEYTSYE